MNFDQFFNDLENLDPSMKNRKVLIEIMMDYITNDISFNFTHRNVDLKQYLSKKQLKEITKKYYES